jgi:Ca-activated chloride channel family protein
LENERLTPRNLRVAVAAVALVVALLPWWEPDPIEVGFVYSTDADELLRPLIRTFNDAQDDVEIKAIGAPSGEVLQAILADDHEDLVLWMPAASTWGRLLNQAKGTEIAPEDGRTLFWSPEVIGTFDSVLDDHPIEGWDDLAELATGKADLGDGEVFRLGHTKPTTSTSGLYALVSEFAAADPDGDPVVDDRSTDRVRSIERSVLHYGDIADDFCPRLFEYSSAYVSAFYMQETTFLKCEERYEDLGLVEVFPDETFVADYPAFVLDASWVSDQEADAARKFLDWLERELDEEQVLGEKFRFGDPWDDDGTGRDAAPGGADLSQRWEPLAVPSGATLAAVQDAWPDVRKAAEVLILLEKGDMHVDSAIESAKRLLRGFIRDLPLKGVTVGLDSFDEQIVEEVPPAVLTRGHRIDLILALNGIGAHGADTRLADSIVESLQKMNFPDRISVIVLVSLGQDDGSRSTLDQVLSELETLSGRVSPIQVFTVSFGDPEGDRVLDAVATDSLGACADFTPEGQDSDRCEDSGADELLEDVKGIV